MPDIRPWQETPVIVFPNLGGLDTSSAPAAVGPTKLVIAQNILVGERKTWQKRGGLVQQNTTTLSGTTAVKTIIDYWKAGSSGVPSESMVAVSGTKIFASTNAGVSFSNVSGTISVPIDSVVTSCVVGDKLLMGFSATPIMQYSQSGNAGLLTGSPPDGNLVASHLGRAWSNEKTDPHRIYFTGVTSTGDGDPTLWSIGNGGGSFTIEPDDGDPVGITGLFQHMDQLYATKLTKIYRIEGRDANSFRPILVVNGIGCVSHNMIVPIGNDVLFPSLVGFHNLAVVANGNLAKEAYLSKDIHTTYQTAISLGRMKHGYGKFIPSLNGVLWAVPLLNQTTNTQVFFYSLTTTQWTFWVNFRCNALCARFNGATEKIELFTGGNSGDIFKYSPTTFVDYGTSAIEAKLQSGHIYVDTKFGHKWAFKNFVLLLYPKLTNSTLLFTYRMDSEIKTAHALISTTSTEDQGGIGAFVPMGPLFIMGINLMGEDVFVQPLTISLKGTGQAFQWTITNNALNEDLEIAGYYLEVEPASPHRARVL